MQIYIPTRGRVGPIRQITLREIPREWRDKTYLVCPPDEQHPYWPNVIHCPVDGIHNVRQWIVDNSRERFLVMMDDDMYFSYRPDIDDVNLERCQNIGPMLQWMQTQLECGFPLVGVSARQGNNHIEPPFRDVTRQMNIHGVDTMVLNKEEIRFNETRFMEDFHVTLSLLERGLPNRVTYEYCWNQRGSGTAGGCSLYRSAEGQAEAAHRLAELHPGSVRVVQKESLSQWSDMKTRTDVVIQWRKAWMSKPEARKWQVYRPAEVVF